jgi:ferritin
LDALISEELRQALCQQISEEKYNSNLYMYIAAFLKNKGFDNLAKHFDRQVDEEHEHSKLICNFLTDMNANVELKDIDAVVLTFNSIVDLANAYLEREKGTTQSLDEEKKIAIKNNDAIAEEFMKQMIDKQRAEIEESTTFVDNAVLCGNDWYKVKVWNDSLGD